MTRTKERVPTEEARPNDDPGPGGGDAETMTLPEENRRALRDEPCSSELYRGLPTVEEARRHEDPILRIRACDLWEPEDHDQFFVAGCTFGHLEGFCSTIGEFMRGGDVRFYGLVIEPFCREMGWGEITGGDLDWEGPGCPILMVDEAWKPR